ncbi:hypothetical protein JCM10207_006277 [Rhodosporidiobolus poonsookiae]
MPRGLPVEILERILLEEGLAKGDLAQCALASSALLPIARAGLYRVVDLSYTMSSDGAVDTASATPMIVDALQRPELGRLVRQITVDLAVKHDLLDELRQQLECYDLARISLRCPNLATIHLSSLSASTFLLDLLFQPSPALSTVHNVSLDRTLWKTLSNLSSLTHLSCLASALPPTLIRLEIDGYLVRDDLEAILANNGHLQLAVLGCASLNIATRDSSFGKAAQINQKSSLVSPTLERSLNSRVEKWPGGVDSHDLLSRARRLVHHWRPLVDGQADVLPPLNPASLEREQDELAQFCRARGIRLTTARKGFSESS